MREEYLLLEFLFQIIILKKLPNYENCTQLLFILK
jgi:hypothetical protein